MWINRVWEVKLRFRRSWIGKGSIKEYGDCIIEDGVIKSWEELGIEGRVPNRGKACYKKLCRNLELPMIQRDPMNGFLVIFTHLLVSKDNAFWEVTVTNQVLRKNWKSEEHYVEGAGRPLVMLGWRSG